MVYVCSLNFFRYFEYVVLQKKKKICKIMHKEATLIIIHYITHLSFHLLRNHRTLQHINYSFLYLIFLVKSELSMHGPMGDQNVHLFLFFLRSDGFTKQSFPMKNILLPRTVFRSFLHKLERNLLAKFSQRN